MRYSKFININENILVEYIYDDNNLIGEPYNILYNSTTNTSCFVSTDQLVPPIKGYQQTNNELYNQLFLFVLYLSFFSNMTYFYNNININYLDLD